MGTIRTVLLTAVILGAAATLAAQDSGYGSPVYWCQQWYSVGVTPDNIELAGVVIGAASGPFGGIVFSLGQSMAADCDALIKQQAEYQQASELCTMQGEEFYGDYEDCMKDLGY